MQRWASSGVVAIAVISAARRRPVNPSLPAALDSERSQAICAAGPSVALFLPPPAPAPRPSASARPAGGTPGGSGGRVGGVARLAGVARPGAVVGVAGVAVARRAVAAPPAVAAGAGAVAHAVPEGRRHLAVDERGDPLLD